MLRRTLAACAVVAASTAIVLPAMATSPASGFPVREPAVQRASYAVGVQVLPQIAQNGANAAAASSAKGVVSVSVSPRPPAGTRVMVSRAVSGTTAFTPVGTALIDASGRATYLTDLSYGLNTFDFKATVAGSESAVVSGAAWASPKFSEEFSGSSMPAMWATRGTDYNPAGARYCSKGDPRAARFGGGVVSLFVMKDPDRSTLCPTRKRGKVVGTFAYRLNGHISTEQSYSFTYGVAAARMKFTKAQGQHGGFWLQPVGNAPGGAEIDVIEWFGDNKLGGLTSFTYHRGAGGVPIKTGDWIKKPTSFLADKSDSFFKRYHVFSVEWTPSAYIFRIDGKESWRSTVGVSHVPEFPILSYLSSDYEIPSLGDKKLPQSIKVDWVRVWQAS